MKKEILYILFACCLCTETLAQTKKDSIDYLHFHRDLYKSLSFAFNSKIASDIINTDADRYSDIGIAYSGEFGNYHKVQTGADINKYMFDAQGGLVTKNGYMSGGFHFSQDYKHSVRFSSTIDPYRGTPYMLADSTNSNWKVQNYSMWTKLAYDVLPKRLAIGLYMALDVARGAKMVDPRPRSNNSNIFAAPSLTLQLGHHKIGAAVDYTNFKEVTNIILYNSSESQKIYVLKGLGQYTFDIFSTTERERKYDGNGIGSMLSYDFSDGSFSFNAQGNYKNYSEEVSDIQNNKPRLRGRYYSDRYDLTIKTKYTSSRCIHQLAWNYSKDKQSGREIIQIFNSSPEINAWQTDSEAPGRWKGDKKRMDLSYNLAFLNKSSYYSPFGTNISYSKAKFNERYDVMDTKLCYSNDIISVSPYYNTRLSSKLLGTFKLCGEYCSVSDFTSAYKEREIDNHTIKDMYFDADADVMSQNYFAAGADLGCGYSFVNGAVLMMNICYKYLKAENGLYRHYPSIALSYHF